jgi:hypothetical protein
MLTVLIIKAAPSAKGHASQVGCLPHIGLLRIERGGHHFEPQQLKAAVATAFNSDDIDNLARLYEPTILSL